jgi:hypothetical protein
MTKFIQRIDHLKSELQCAIIIVHHSGLSDAKRGRGSSALRGAMDFEYVCELGQDSVGNNLVSLSSTKTKDHESPITKVFQSVIKDLGIVDDDKEPITSVVLVETHERPAKGNQLSDSQRIALDSLNAVIATKGDASEDAWRAEAYTQGISSSDKPDTKRKAFDRAKKHLLDHGLVDVKDDVYRVI